MVWHTIIQSSGVRLTQGMGSLISTARHEGRGVQCSSEQEVQLSNGTIDPIQVTGTITVKGKKCMVPNKDSKGDYIQY